MSRANIEIDLDTLAESIAEWDNEDVLKLIKRVDELKSEWDFVEILRPWVEGEHRKMVKEELEDKAHREQRCQKSAEYPDLSFHTSPHKGCILR